MLKHHLHHIHHHIHHHIQNLNEAFFFRHPHVHLLLMALFYVFLMVLFSMILAVLAYACF
jgi:hypothetical protein